MFRIYKYIWKSHYSLTSEHNLFCNFHHKHFLISTVQISTRYDLKIVSQTGLNKKKKILHIKVRIYVI